MKFINNAARDVVHASGSWVAIIISVGLIAVWVIGGLIFGFSDKYSAIAGTVTGIVTFVMVFMIQNSQNRDTAALQAKLDEIIAATGGARNEMIGIEKESDEPEIEGKRKNLGYQDPGYEL